MRLIDADALERDIDKYCCGNDHFKHWVQVQRTIGGWISVKDRLPPQRETVIVAINDEHGDTPFKYTYFGWYLPDGKCWIVDDDATLNVYAWMPLPEPPEDVSK